jgi:hypothetical protein
MLLRVTAVGQSQTSCAEHQRVFDRDWDGDGLATAAQLLLPNGGRPCELR